MLYILENKIKEEYISRGERNGGSGAAAFFFNTVAASLRSPRETIFNNSSGDFF
jgi:hypothetical protein